MELCRKVVGKPGAKNTKPYVSITISTNVLCLNASALNLLQLTDGDSIMFGFDSNLKIGYIFEEEEQEDNYTIKVDKRKYVRFGSAHLVKTMIKVFDIKGNNNLIYFTLSEKKNADGFWEFKKV